MRLTTFVLGAGLVLTMSGVAGAASGPAPAAGDPPSTSATQTIPLFMFDQPRVPLRENVTRDDMRDMPTPSVDRLSNGVRVRIDVGDPQCLREDMRIPGVADPPNPAGSPRWRPPR
jgi:hypothetical protein